MKLKRLRKNAFYCFAYGSSKKRFKRNIRSSPDKGLSRIPARKLKQVMNKACQILSQPLGYDKYKAIMDFLCNG